MAKGEMNPNQTLVIFLVETSSHMLTAVVVRVEEEGEEGGSGLVATSGIAKT